jgi:hypothetical protein
MKIERWLMGLSLLAILTSACTSGPATSTPAAAATDIPTPAATAPPRITTGFETDFTQHSVPYAEVTDVIPKDRIPAIDAPTFVTTEAADAWLAPKEPVLIIQIGDETRLYPIQILIWHEIVNDTVGGVPVAATYCPLCNTAIAFERTVEGQALDFGTTGRLRYSNLIMYDRPTESWWQQATGEAIAGEFTGQQLTFVPAPMVSWADARTAYPEGDVLSRETGHVRDYGQNPYPGYDDQDSTPFLYDGPVTPDDLPSVARVLGLELAGEAVAYPYQTLEKIHAANDTVGETAIVVLWEPGAASAMDSARIAQGRDVGAAMAFERTLNGETLTFVWAGERLIDEATSSTWNVLGQATSGPLAGQQLEPVAGLNFFWFSWAAFHPQTRVYAPPQAP